MRKFAFIHSDKIHKTYNWWLNKYRRHQDFLDIVKVWVLATCILFTAFIYLFYVNKSSTRGYFLRQENQNLNAISFQYEILKNKILTHKQSNWKEIYSSKYKKKIIDVRAEVVAIPITSELAMK